MKSLYRICISVAMFFGLTSCFVTPGNRSSVNDTSLSYLNEYVNEVHVLMTDYSVILYRYCMVELWMDADEAQREELSKTYFLDCAVIGDENNIMVMMKKDRSFTFEKQDDGSWLYREDDLKGIRMIPEGNGFRFNWPGFYNILFRADVLVKSFGCDGTTFSMTAEVYGEGTSSSDTVTFFSDNMRGSGNIYSVNATRPNMFYDADAVMESLKWFNDVIAYVSIERNHVEITEKYR